jgi:hypothetical protein
MKLVSHLGLVFGVIVLLTICAYFISLFGAPALGSGLGPLGGYELGLSATHMADNFGPGDDPGASFRKCATRRVVCTQCASERKQAGGEPAVVGVLCASLGRARTLPP